MGYSAKAYIGGTCVGILKCVLFEYTKNKSTFSGPTGDSKLYSRLVFGSPKRSVSLSLCFRVKDLKVLVRYSPFKYFDQLAKSVSVV